MHIKLANVSFTFAGIPNVVLTTTGLSDALGHVHSETLLSRTRDSHTLLFTNTGLANAPTRKRPVTHSGHKNGPVTYAGLPEAAVTALYSLTLLVGLHWMGWIDYIGFTNAAISLVGYWLDYIGWVGLITLVSQTLLSRWLAIGWITLDWLDCLHWFHNSRYLIGLHWTGWIDYIGFTTAAISLVGYWMDYIGLVGLFTLVSQTLLSISLVGNWLDYIGLAGLITLVSQTLLSRSQTLLTNAWSRI